VIAAAPALSAFAMPDHRPGIAIHRDSRAEPASVDLAAAVAVAQAQADGPDGLPATWCGDETAGAGIANRSAPEAAAQFKVVYAYAADRGRIASAVSRTRCRPMWRSPSGSSAPRVAGRRRSASIRVIVAAENADGTTASASAPTPPIAAIAITRAATRHKHRSRR
jgi:hypothetical protein